MSKSASLQCLWLIIFLLLWSWSPQDFDVFEMSWLHLNIVIKDILCLWPWWKVYWRWFRVFPCLIIWNSISSILFIIMCGLKALIEHHVIIIIGVKYLSVSFELRVKNMFIKIFLLSSRMIMLLYIIIVMIFKIYIPV